jgi:hypothetical protein
MIGAMRRTGTRLAVSLAAVVLTAGAAAADAGAAYFSNFQTEIMEIPQFGPAEPYPSVVPVTGIPKPVLRVRLVDLSFLHLNPEDMDVLLAAPGGKASMLMSDACGQQDAIEDDGILTLADGAAQHLPMASCVAGTYKPTNYAVDASLPPPAPPVSGFGYPASLAQFSGAGANGDWKLYVHDDSGAVPNGLGVGGGFGLDILVKARCRGRVADQTGANGKGDVLGGKRRGDALVGFGGADLLFGKRGRDFLCGSRGPDDLFGGRGRDVLVGGRGRDRLVGGKGDDRCIGGPGRDRLEDC